MKYPLNSMRALRFEFSFFPLLVMALSLSACKKDEAIHPASYSSLCIGHHGNKERAMENSLASLQSAQDIGADGVEVDVQNTQDDHAIVFHDEDLATLARSKAGKQCDFSSRIKKLTLKQIRDNCELKDGQEIPTLAEVLLRFNQRGFKMFIDVKDLPNDETLNNIRDYYHGHYEDVSAMVTFSATLRTVYQVRSKLPEGVKLFLTGNEYIPGTENGFDGIDVRLASDVQIRLLQQKNIQVSLFDVNTTQTQVHALELGINYITTDKLASCVGLKKR
ncbi:MAG: hypothetical protein H7333_08215 [Bdellovibrionales bacterium]|nr:hypothetical protein [Oligoflexia bacterium]